MRRTYRYRIYPTKCQANALEAQLREACALYNAALQHRRDMWRDHGRSVTFYDQDAELRHLRAEGLLDPAVSFKSQRAVLRRLDRAFQAFFRRVKAGERPGFPRFKASQRFDTLEFCFGHGIALTDVGRLRVQNVGHIKVRLHRAIPDGAKLCEARITRRGGRWYVAINLDNIEPRALPPTGRNVGLDLGISTFLATSDGELIPGPRANREAAKAVRRAQRRVARRKRGSNRRAKAIAQLVRQREHEANIRRDHTHKTARSLVQRYDTICVENLNMCGLVKGVLARDCNDQGWASFVGLLHEKAEDAARRVVLVDPRNTSQACSACGLIVPKALGVRVHSCVCGYTADRDVNAACNVLARGVAARMGPSGVNGGEKKPVPLPEKPPSGVHHWPPPNFDNETEAA